MPEHPINRRALADAEGAAPTQANGVDSVWFHEWRRELSDRLDAWRTEVHDELRTIVQRLGGIENRMAEREATLNRHDDQIKEALDIVNELEGRITAVEQSQVLRLAERLGALEEDKRKRDTIEESSRNSVARAVAIAALCTGASGVVLAVLAFIGWLIIGYAKGHP